MKNAIRNVTESIFANVDIRAILLLTVFGAPVVGLFILGSSLFPVS